jgi:hypothetical protein
LDECWYVPRIQSGHHRNTVLYRLRVAHAELGIDPRRPADALKLLRDAGR